METTNEKILHMRPIPPKQKHPTVFETFDEQVDDLLGHDLVGDSLPEEEEKKLRPASSRSPKRPAEP